MIGRLVIYFGMIFHSFGVFGQLTETYFNNQEGQDRGIATVSKQYGSFLIIAGSSFDRYLGQPSITKVDLNGNVVWNTTSLDTTRYTYGPIDNFFIDGDFIYAVYAMKIQGQRELWKVSAISGEILWKRSFTANWGYYNSQWYFIDYDATRFIITHSTQVQPFRVEVRMTFVDKATGSALNTYFLGVHDANFLPGVGVDVAVPFGLAIDSHKDIYYTRNDSIFKVSSANPALVLWKTKRSEANILAYQHIHIDEDDNLFLFGSRNAAVRTGEVLGFNKDTGAFLWEAKATDNSLNVGFSDMADDGNNIIVAWKYHNALFDQNYDILSTKIDKASGTIVWKSTHSFESGEREAALSLALDNAGDVLLTGYHRSSLETGEWAFVKLDGTTGASIYGKTFSEDESIRNYISGGLDVYFIDGFAYLVGNIQTTYPGTYNQYTSTPAVIKINPTSQEVVYKKYLYGWYQFPSSTLAMELQGDNTVQLKQVGRHVVVGLYNNGDNIIWEKSLGEGYAMLGSHLIVSADQTVTVIASLKQPDFQTPFFYNLFSHIYTFDLQGTLLSKSEFENFSNPLETIKDGNSLFVLDTPPGLYITKIENGVASRKQLEGMPLLPGITPSPAATKTLLPFSNKEVIVAGYFVQTDPDAGEYSSTRLIKINKSTLAMTDIRDAHPTPSKVVINYVQKINDQTWLFGGKHYDSGKDALARFNLNTSTIEWSKEYTPSSEISKFVFNKNKSAIYTIGTKGDDLVVRKIDTSTGNVIWTYDYNYSDTIKDIPVDIDVDLTTNKIVFVGYNEVIGSQDASDVFIHTINTAGEFIDLIIKHGEPGGKSKPNFVKFHSDEMWYIGGNLNHDGQKDGFLYSMNTSAWNVGPCVGALDGVVSEVEGQLIVSDENATYQWIDCTTGLEIPEAINQSLIPSREPGSYSVEISKDGCSIDSDCYAFEEFVTGFSETAESGIRIFPNPATYEVSVDLGIEVNAATISIQDSKGAVIVEQQIRNQKEVTLKTNLQRGLYLIYIKSEDITAVRKLLIE